LELSSRHLHAQRDRALARRPRRLCARHCADRASGGYSRLAHRPEIVNSRPT